MLHVIAIIPDRAGWPLLTSASRISQLLDLLFLLTELFLFVLVLLCCLVLVLFCFCSCLGSVLAVDRNTSVLVHFWTRILKNTPNVGFKLILFLFLYL